MGSREKLKGSRVKAGNLFYFPSLSFTSLYYPYSLYSWLPLFSVVDK
jgi:hypothetical protein